MVNKLRKAVIKKASLHRYRFSSMVEASYERRAWVRFLQSVFGVIGAGGYYLVKHKDKHPPTFT